MAEWATPDKKRKVGFEPEPIKAPLFTPFVWPMPTILPVQTPELVPARRK